MLSCTTLFSGFCFCVIFNWKTFFFLFGVSYNVGLDAWLHILFMFFFSLMLWLLWICCFMFHAGCRSLPDFVTDGCLAIYTRPFLFNRTSNQGQQTKSSLACSVKFHQLHYCLCFGRRVGQNRGPFGPNQATGYVLLRSLNFIVLFQDSVQFIFVTRAVHSMSYFGAVVNQTLVNVVIFLESLTNQICSGASLLKWFLHLNMNSVL